MDRVWPYRQSICAHVCAQGPFQVGTEPEAERQGGTGQGLGLESKGQLFPTSVDLNPTFQVAMKVYLSKYK